MAAIPSFLIVTDISACTGLVMTSPNGPNSWMWTAKLSYDGEVQEAWKSDQDLPSADAAIADCYSFLRSMDFAPQRAVKLETSIETG